MPSSQSHPVIAELVAKSIASGDLVEAALEHALIGFEESSEKRVYLYNLAELPGARKDGWLNKAVGDNVSSHRKFSGPSVRPMTPVYAEDRGHEIRVKWTEEQIDARYDAAKNDTVRTPRKKNIVLIADFSAKTAELRLDPPENVQPHEQLLGQTSADAYYSAYIAKAAEILQGEMNAVAFDRVIPNLVKEETPRVVRIHIDNHTNQTDLGLRAKSLKADVRDQVEWRKLYNEFGHTWTWEYQMLYWLPKPSAGQLKRELYSHLNADVGYLKLNADCSDDEVTYVVSQIRSRQV